MTSKNLIASTAHEAFEQYQKCKKARGQEFEKESKQLDNAVKMSQVVSDMANIQLKQLALTGFLPDENILVDDTEIKMVNAKRNLIKPQEKQNFLNEFIQK